MKTFALLLLLGTATLGWGRTKPAKGEVRCTSFDGHKWNKLDCRELMQPSPLADVCGIKEPAYWQPEPLDVPAIQQRCIHEENFSAWCRVDNDGYHDRHPDGWLCEDWDRILLVDEGGKRHCIKFPTEDKQK